MDSFFIRLKDIDHPLSSISAVSTPLALRKTLAILYEGNIKDVWLVGGTALAGYYAQHRKSDDLDLFATTSASFAAMLHQIRELPKAGARFSDEITTPTYFHGLVEFQKHSFTLDLVLDENLGRVGHAIKTEDGVWVTGLATLFCMKAACLVSRCSEKDLFDLDWIFSQTNDIKIQDLINEAKKVDAGVNIESLLLSLSGTHLREEACQFTLPSTGITPKQAYKKIINLQKKLIHELLDFSKKEKENPMAADLKKVASLQKKILSKRHRKD